MNLLIKNHTIYDSTVSNNCDTKWFYFLNAYKSFNEIAETYSEEEIMKQQIFHMTLAYLTLNRIHRWYTGQWQSWHDRHKGCDTMILSYAWYFSKKKKETHCLPTHDTSCPWQPNHCHDTEPALLTAQSISCLNQ